MNPPNQCPVCRARFRSASLCSRCGADLTPLMLLATQAWQLRAEARQSLESGDFERAHELALASQNIQLTPSGDSLRLLSAWLRSTAPRNGKLLEPA